MPGTVLARASNSDQLAKVTTADMAHVAEQMLLDCTTPRKRWRLLCEISEQLQPLRRADQIMWRLKMRQTDWQRAQAAQAKREAEEEARQEKEAALRPTRAAEVWAKLLAEYDGGKGIEEILWFRAAVQCDLPMTAWYSPPMMSASEPAPVNKTLAVVVAPGPTTAGAAGNPAPVRPCQSESNQIKPTQTMQTQNAIVAGVADPGSASIPASEPPATAGPVALSPT